MFQKMCFKMERRKRLFSKLFLKLDLKMIWFCLMLQATEFTIKNFQTIIILQWETLKHFHAIFKKHFFVAVAQKNWTVSSTLKLRDDVSNFVSYKFDVSNFKETIFNTSETCSNQTKISSSKWSPFYDIEKLRKDQSFVIIF